MAPEPTVIRTRRRGAHLQRALYEATLAELIDVGYGALSMEGIAARAHTGKAALYRRWPTKRELVRDALRHALPPLPKLRPNRPVRENLLAVFAGHCVVLAGKSAFPGLGVVGQILHDPELRATFAQDLIAPRLTAIESILRAGVDSGELAVDAVTPLTAKIGPALIIQHVLLTGTPPSRRDLIAIVTAVIGPPETG